MKNHLTITLFNSNQKNNQFTMQALYSVKVKSSIEKSNNGKKLLLWYSTKLHNFTNILTNGFSNSKYSTNTTNFGNALYFYDILGKAITNSFSQNNLSFALFHCYVK